MTDSHPSNELPPELIEPSRYAVEELLRDGAQIRIRAIHPDDKELLLEHFRHLSAQSVYFRFMGMRRKLTEDDLHHFTELDFSNHVGLAATLDQDGRERFIGVGRYMRGTAPRRAEVAFAVLDEHQGRGIGTLLLEHLSRIARAGGITEFEALVLGDNKRMLDVFAESGFKIRRTFESGVVHVYLPIKETRESREAAEAREGTAASGVAQCPTRRRD